MTPRARMTLFVFAAGLLLGAGVLFALRDEEDPPATPSAERAATAPEEEAVAAAASEEVLEEERAEAEAERARELRRHDPHGDPHHAEPRLRDERRLERIADEAEAVAREFYGGFAAYELGRLDAEVRATFRRTATRAFARMLVEAPPRVPLGAERPGQGELGQLQLAAVDSDPARRELVAAELVGEVERGGHRSAVAIELVNDGGWRVAGLSR